MLPPRLSDVVTEFRITELPNVLVNLITDYVGSYKTFVWRSDPQLRIYQQISLDVIAVTYVQYPYCHTRQFPIKNLERMYEPTGCTFARSHVIETPPEALKYLGYSDEIPKDQILERGLPFNSIFKFFEESDVRMEINEPKMDGTFCPNFNMYIDIDVRTNGWYLWINNGIVHISDPNDPTFMDTCLIMLRRRNPKPHYYVITYECICFNGYCASGVPICPCRMDIVTPDGIIVKA